MLLVAVLVGFRINAAEGVGLGLEEPDSSVRLWGDLAALAVSTHRDEALRRLAEMERLKRERMASITLPAIHVHKPKEEVEITLMTDPEGAQVIRDGETLGPTPRTWKIKRSSTMARVVVRKRGYQTQTLMLPSDRDQKVTVRMKRLPAMRNNFIRKIWKK